MKIGRLSSALGVWTLEEKGQLPHVDVTFETAKPTLSHLALVTLEHAGKSFFFPVVSTASHSIICHSQLEICVHIKSILAK